MTEADFLNDFYVDIHCHLTLRATNVVSHKKKANFWHELKNKPIKNKIARWAGIQTKGIAKVSQSNLYAAADGKVRVLFDSLYPVEKNFMNFRKVPDFLMGKEGGRDILRTVTGAHKKNLKKYGPTKPYYQHLEAQYKALLKAQGASPDNKHHYKVVNNYTELKSCLHQNPNNIAIVLTIEGAHAFGSGTAASEKMSDKQLKKVLSHNIGNTKEWAHVPFMVNLTHHFWNQLCGHARSFKPTLYAAYNQKKGLNKGVTQLGWHVIEELLATDNGKRILIDIKHMSAESRQAYYKFVKAHNRINTSSPIPIVCTHTGVSGYNTLYDAVKQSDRVRKMRRTRFHSWSINMCNEDIRAIHQSKGLMGIMMDKGLLGGVRTLKRIDAINDEIIQRNAYVALIWDNIFQAIKVVQQKTAWDIISIGSDYDGIITHVDCYHNISQLHSLKEDLIDYLKKYQTNKYLWYGYSPEELVHKIMQGNAINFMKNNFK